MRFKPGRAEICLQKSHFLIMIQRLFKMSTIKKATSVGRVSRPDSAPLTRAALSSQVLHYFQLMQKNYFIEMHKTHLCGKLRSSNRRPKSAIPRQVITHDFPTEVTVGFAVRPSSLQFGKLKQVRFYRKNL